ncbi:ribonuclease H-like domain-containing protein [Tanacetum coccineum]
MVIRFRVGTNRPTQRLNLHVSFVSPLPKSYRDAFNDSNWQNAMNDKYHALIKNNTWTLMPRLTDANIVRSSSQALLQQIITSLHQEFSMTDLGSLNYFLGILVTLDSSGMFLSQKKYVVEIIERAHMINFQRVCLYMHDPREPHFLALKQILQYVRGYDVILGNNLLSWSSKHQPTLSRSSAEAEYRGVANVVAKTCWLRNLLRELHTPLSFATLVYCDNVSSSFHVPSRYQYADIFTKGLPSALFEDFRTSLSVWCPPAPTVGEC